MLDVRLPIGALFLILGIMITAWGYTNPPVGALVTKMGPMPVNVDITWGIFMTVFGIGMFSLAKLDEALAMERALAEEKTRAAALELAAGVASAPEIALADQVESKAESSSESAAESSVDSAAESSGESKTDSSPESPAETTEKGRVLRAGRAQLKIFLTRSCRPLAAPPLRASTIYICPQKTRCASQVTEKNILIDSQKPHPVSLGLTQKQARNADVI